jgi:hypothetical protein
MRFLEVKTRIISWWKDCHQYLSWSSVVGCTLHPMSINVGIVAHWKRSITEINEWLHQQFISLKSLIHNSNSIYNGLWKTNSLTIKEHYRMLTSRQQSSCYCGHCIRHIGWFHLDIYIFFTTCRSSSIITWNHNMKGIQNEQWRLLMIWILMSYLILNITGCAQWTDILSSYRHCHILSWINQKVLPTLWVSECGLRLKVA